MPAHRKETYNRNDRADHRPGARGSYEAARKRVLAAANVCAICGQTLDKSIKFPHPMSATVDHIIPIAKGGHPFALENLQAVHLCCNQRKGDDLIPKEAETPKHYDNRDLPLSLDWANEEQTPDLENLHARGYEFYARGILPLKPGTGKAQK